MAKVSIKRLQEALRFQPETGKLFWRERPRHHFDTEAVMKTWNARWAGNEALTTKTDLGYKSGRFDGKIVKGHRIAWAVHLGKWPEQIDHINGNRADNRLCNLRDVGFGENARNQKRPQNNTSGVVGVSRRKGRNVWQSYIHADGRLQHLGNHKCFGAALKARRAAEVQFGYHVNHGRSA